MRSSPYSGQSHAPSAATAWSGIATSCRICRSKDLQTVLSLGELPLANALVKPSDLAREDARYPLTLMRCNSCGISQLREQIPRDVLFREYCYFSSCTATVVEYARRFALRTIEEQRLDASTLVLEIASNDGYLLQHYRAAGVPVLGIEPAANTAAVARDRGIETICDFFSLDLARQLKQRGISPRVIHAHNVLAHVEDLGDVLEGVRLLLEPGSLFVVKVPYLRDLIDGLEFDTIYHEHNYYFAIEPLSRLLDSHGLHFIQIEHSDLHGGSLRLWIARKDSPFPVHPSVGEMLASERSAGINLPSYYETFQQRILALGEQVRSLLEAARSQGVALAGYAAAAKATQLLNYFSINAGLIPYVCDISPHKQGHWIPGVRIPVVSPQALLDRKPGLVLLLAWNFANEILEQQAEFRRRGGKFLIPLPEPRIV